MANFLVLSMDQTGTWNVKISVHGSSHLSGGNEALLVKIVPETAFWLCKIQSWRTAQIFRKNLANVKHNHSYSFQLEKKITVIVWEEEKSNRNFPVYTGYESTEHQHSEWWCVDETCTFQCL